MNVAVLAVLCAVVLVAFTGTSHAGVSLALYVATNGNDAWSG